MFVHRMLHDQEPWPAWKDYPALLKHGLIAFGGMVYYYSPALLLGYFAWRERSLLLLLPTLLLGLLATIAIPGYMTHYCRKFDPSEIYNPLRALSRVAQGGGNYWRAWGIALTALLLSFLGLLAFGIGFLVSSVWFWQVAGFSFASVFAQPHFSKSHLSK